MYLLFNHSTVVAGAAQKMERGSATLVLEAEIQI